MANTNLKKRGHTWFMRVCVPKDLVALLKRKEIVKSLKTRDFKEANKRCTLERALQDAEFDKLRKQQASTLSDKDVLSTLSRHELVGLVGKWVTSVQAAEEKGRLKSTGDWTEESRRHHFIELQQEEFTARQEKLGFGGEQHDGLTTASHFLKAEGLSFDYKSEAFRNLGMVFTKTIHDLARMRLDEWAGKPTSPLSVMGENLGEDGSKKQMHLGALLEEYFADPGASRGKSTLNNYRIVRKALEEVVGLKTPLHRIDRDLCKKVRDLIYELPSRSAQRAPGRTLVQAAAIRKNKGWPKQEPATFNGHMHKLRAIMEYAVREGYLQKNPASGFNIPETVKTKDKRNPFKMETLQTIFNAPLYKGCVDDQEGYNKPGSNRPRNTRFWLPLIGLFMGLRLNEICQLQVGDIEVKNGILALKVTEFEDENSDTAGKMVKTAASVRTVPVHPMLVRIGFDKYVTTMKAAGHVRLFPDLEVDTRGYLTRGFSQWFSRFLENNGVKTKRTSFHSFRHNYRDAQREAELPGDVAHAIGGWTQDKVSDGYGGGVSLKKMNEYVPKIAYPELDLSHLYE